ncbi:hypothetical protein AUC70_12990 [Methyloceanibacter stevinii]|uniref:Transposase zinc-ribbon domain-containing protein n=2 Tax=Methyloceanibacter stevinii TaxID=1774970 RepID=A0A1E3VUH9_9HYPH|nr:hypothetical protein AUC70_12990 [Methyloceanibacter stevinii]
MSLASGTHMKRRDTLDLGTFRDEEAAYEFVERRIWPDGPVCPHCGSNRRIGRLNGASTRIHTYKCYDCRRPFTVKLGTIFQDSKVPMHKWLQLIMLSRALGPTLTSYKAAQILGVTAKTATAMLSRLRILEQKLRLRHRSQ